MRRVMAAVVLALVGTSSGADAPATIDPGERIRVTVAQPAASRPLTGTLETLREGSLVVSADGRSHSFALAEVRRVEVSSGRRVSRRWTILGAVAGGAVGAVVGGCLANKDDYGVACAGQDDTKYLIGGVVGGVVGGALGAWLGQTEAWDDVDLRRLTTSDIPARISGSDDEAGPSPRRR